ncbi:hypothetical protein VL13_26345 [Burkholderia lata]|nr:hypothetical protein VL13_26345 [Burkholderia lata]
MGKTAKIIPVHCGICTLQRVSDVRRHALDAVCHRIKRLLCTLYALQRCTCLCDSRICSHARTSQQLSDIRLGGLHTLRKVD